MVAKQEAADAVVARPSPSTVPLRETEPLRGYSRALVPLDAVALLIAGAASLLVRDPLVSLTFSALVAVAVAIGWLITLALVGAYEPRQLGVGTTEFARVFTASIIIFGATATAGYLTGAESLRSEILVAIPLGLLLLLMERRVARAWLHGRRASGDFRVRTLVVGTPEDIDRLEVALRQDTSTGYAITATTPPPDADIDAWVESVIAEVSAGHIDAVMLACDDGIAREAVRALAWRLGGSGTDLLVSPMLGDLAGPRTVARSASRLPLIHLDEAQLTGPQQGLKRTGDILAASIGLLLMLPVLLVVALAVKLTSRGPVLFRQQRVGRDGRIFVIAKFRTMVDGAHHMHDEILGPPVGRTAEVTARDPRITPLGRVLRRWSLDEFPQLWSVITGDMSLVGPRPLMPEEMPWLEPLGQRRHLMRPGITGLWQVNGRKEVDWADRIRLDIDYVERWSPLVDAVLLLRTVKAVITGTGAH